MDISNWIAHRAEWSPGKVALRFEGQEVTYAQLEERVARLAGGLADELGVGRGDRVAYLGWNSPALLELLFACARLGAIFVPLNARMTVEQHRPFLSNCQPRCLVVESVFHQHVERCLEDRERVSIVLFGGSSPEESGGLKWEVIVGSDNPRPTNTKLPLSTPLLIAYTSGTTGVPKGALLTQEALFYNAMNATAAFDLTSRDEVLTVLPMFHVGGMNIHTTPALHAGATVTIHRQFDPARALQEIEQRRITLLLAVPSAARALISHPDWEKTDISSLRCVGIGATVVPPDMMRPWFERDVPVTQTYGLTETCPIAIVVPLEETERKLGSVGKPVLYCQARVIGENRNGMRTGERGEIVLRGPNLLTEYWMNPEATKEAFIDGWFRTGDVGHVDEEGYFYVDDRIKDIIIVGPSSVYPADLERILAECNGIVEAAVVGRPDPELGEVPVACVVLKAGHSMSVNQVKALFEGRLAQYQHPRDVVFMDSLPHTALGKVQKSLLREQVKGT